MSQMNDRKVKSAIVILVCSLCVSAAFLYIYRFIHPSDDEISYNVIINEVMSSNSKYAPHSCGEYTDWVELYNDSDTAVSLDGCWLTDNETEPYRYSLDGITIEPYGYKIIYLSSQISDSDEQPVAPFGLSANGETLIIFTKSGMEIDRMEVPRLRENISYGYNDKYELMFWLSPSFGEKNSGSCADSANALAYTLCPIQISEYMLKNSMGIKDCDFEYSNWIELYNFGDEGILLNGFSLTDKDSGSEKWSFPEGVYLEAGEYLTVYCSGKDKIIDGELHTDFTLGRNSDYLALWTNENVLAQEITLQYGGENISTSLDNNGNYLFSCRATPGDKNYIHEGTQSNLFAKLDNGIIISEVCSVSDEDSSDYIEIYNYSDSDISLSGYTIGNDIGVPFFTFPDIVLESGEYIVVYCDGKNIADSEKNLHADTKLSSGGEKIYLTDHQGNVRDFFESGKQRKSVTSGRIGSDTSARWFFASSTPGAENSKGYVGYTEQPMASMHGGFVVKGTKITISADENAYITYTTDGSVPTASSKKYNSSITINKTTVLRFAAFSDDLLSSDVVTETYFVTDEHTIPVVSLSGSPRKISDKDTGILYNSKSKDEHACHVEYFDETGVKAVEFDAGVALFGYSSREYYQKGLRLRLREVYGENEVNYPFFGDNSVDSFSSLLLRPGGEDQISSKIRDDLIPMIIRGMDLDYQETQPAALYVNGKYWGLYFVRERLDANYIKYKYGYDKDSVDIIKGNRQVVTGSVSQYNKLVNYIDFHDMTNDEEYKYAIDQIDVDSLINFWIVETYFCNFDIGNIKCFRVRDTGKWRWMIYDMDWAMWPTTWDSNMIESKLLTTGYLPTIQNNKIMRNLLKNDQFRDRFITLYCYHIENTFESKRATELLDELTAYIQPELTRQYKVMKYPKHNAFEKNWSQIRKFLSFKPEMAYQQLMSAFDLTNEELEQYKAAAGALSFE